MLVFARDPQCALFERGSLHVVLKGPMVTLLVSNRAEKRSLNPWVPFTQTQSLCAVLSKDRMRRADTSPADGPSETGGELSTAQRGHCRGWRRFCPERQAQFVCPQKRLHKLPCLPRHPLLRALSHLCSLFQSGSKAPCLPSTIHNTSVNILAIIPPSF